MHERDLRSSEAPSVFGQWRRPCATDLSLTEIVIPSRLDIYLPQHRSPSRPLSPSLPRATARMRITKDQLKGLDQYKYSGIDKSVVSRYFLGPFWTWLVTIFPRSLAPNTVSRRSGLHGHKEMFGGEMVDGSHGGGREIRSQTCRIHENKSCLPRYSSGNSGDIEA